jgi:predicted enzyme related to lactoylglutathione lyase
MESIFKKPQWSAVACKRFRRWQADLTSAALNIDMANQVVWFDMPVKELERAVRFYSAVLGKPISKQKFGNIAFAVLPHEQQTEVSGCLTPGSDGDGTRPADHGVLLYFNCQGRLDQAVQAVEPNGGKILQPRHGIGSYGYRAIILDSEGNRIALHSM